MNCWICGAIADSREHKFKRSDLKRSSATWALDDRPYLFRGGETRRLQSPNSEHATFGKVLCSKCNSTRTQPYDRAYERFSEWINDQGPALMERAELDFTDIYGAEFAPQVLNLLKYFAKHFGCRLAGEGSPVPIALACSLSVEDLRPFEVSFTRSNGTKGLPVRGPGILANFPVFGRWSNSTGEASGPWLTGMVVGHLDVLHRYEFAERYSWEGDAVDPHSRLLRLGYYVGPQAGPHIDDGHLPGSDKSRSIKIGDRKFIIPILAAEQARFILSLDKPSSDKSLGQNLDARLQVALAILNLWFPEVTRQFLATNMAINDTEDLWRIAFAERV